MSPAAVPTSTIFARAIENGSVASEHLQTSHAVVTVEVADDDRAIKVLVDEWRALRTAHHIDTPDSDPDFFLGIYRELGANMSPHIALVRVGGSAAGLIVARRVVQAQVVRVGSLRCRTPRLRCMEIVCGGLISNGNREVDQAILDHLQSLLAARSVDLIEVHHVESNHMIALIRQQPGWRRSALLPEGHHIVRLLDDAGVLIQRHSSKTRNTFRREDKKLAAKFNDDLQLEVRTRPEEISPFITQASVINQASYHRALDVGVCDNNRWRAIVTSLAKTGAWRGYILTGGGQPIAYMLGAVYGKRCTFMATGYCREHHVLSPGKVMMNRVLEAVSAEGVAIADFGWGDAEYKTMLASERLSELTIQLYGSSASARMAFIMQRLARWGTQRAKAMAGAGIVASLRRRWRERLRRQASSVQNQGEGL
jgi:CelD/BcsL family acetyltransferase involved in cellulose biosynthesis